MRLRTPVALTVATLFVIETGGHWLAYRLASPDATERAALLAATGHGYLEELYALAALCVVVAMVSLGGRVAAAAKGARFARGPSWRLALIPSATFLLQEHVERLVHSGQVDWATVTEPAVAIGIAIQIPCGFLAVWLIRVLLRGAYVLGRVLGRPQPAGRVRVRAAHAPRPDPVKPAALALCPAERGPPAFA